MQFLIYFLIAIFTTTLGGLTGMGGGVMIKPALDLLGDYDAATIGILSSLSVFAMAIVSVSKQLRNRAKFDEKVVIPLAVGSIVGGTVGQMMLDAIIEATNSDVVKIVQNAILAVLIVVVFVYMLIKDKVKSYHLSGYIPSALVGVFLGISSSFLGIGGGPINVAIFMFLFSYEAKIAALSSIVTILFSQISKLSAVAMSGELIAIDWSIPPFMIVGAIAGGFIGSKLTALFTNKQVEIAFNSVQVLVFFACILNIVRTAVNL